MKQLLLFIGGLCGLVFAASGQVAKKDITRGVDELKYQTKEKVAQVRSEELGTIKFRYKQPDGDKSKEMVRTVSNRRLSIEACSEDTRFASSVALFGMLLRESTFVKEGDEHMVTNLARDSKGEDSEGYRADFIKMVKMADLKVGAR